MRNWRPQRGRFLSGFAPILAASLLLPPSAATADEPRTLAIANFDFRDTSGEVKDQTAEHQARLQAFGITLRERLADSGKIGVASLACEADQCTARNPGLKALSEQAKDAKAKYLLIGEVHKMSTLVGWVKFAVVDLDANKPVCDRFLTYRGDTDEAWQRAAEFAARDVGTNCFP